MLLMSGVCVKINGADILADVDLGVAPHTLSGLLGRNGAGKTTLMRAVMGALPIAGGGLTFDGRPIAPLPAYERARLGIAYARGSSSHTRLECRREHSASLDAIARCRAWLRSIASLRQFQNLCRHVRDQRLVFPVACAGRALVSDGNWYEPPVIGRADRGGSTFSGKATDWNLAIFERRDQRF